MRNCRVQGSRPRLCARTFCVVSLALLLGVSVVPGFAQDTGSIRGTVVDQEGRPVGGANVVVSQLDDVRGRFQVETTGGGEYQQETLAAGLYSVTAAKDELGGALFRVRVRPGRIVSVNFILEPVHRVETWLTERGEREVLVSTFAAGVEASRARDYETAIEQFTQAIELSPTCLECNFNLAVAYTEVERFADAEVAFKRVLEITPDYSAAYYGLASLYRKQGREEEAGAARGEANRLALERLAAGRAQAEDAVDRGVTFLNAGNVADARQRFEEAMRVHPGFAPAHYWLGVALLESEAADPAAAANAFRSYLQLTQDGEYVEQAREHLSSVGR